MVSTFGQSPEARAVRPVWQPLPEPSAEDRPSGLLARVGGVYASVLGEFAPCLSFGPPWRISVCGP